METIRSPVSLLHLACRKPSHPLFHYSTSPVQNRFRSEIGQIMLQPLFSNTYLQGKNKKLDNLI